VALLEPERALIALGFYRWRAFAGGCRLVPRRLYISVLYFIFTYYKLEKKYPQYPHLSPNHYPSTKCFAGSLDDKYPQSPATLSRSLSMAACSCGYLDPFQQSTWSVALITLHNITLACLSVPWDSFKPFL